MDILDYLQKKIGNTPLTEIKGIKIPNNNRIFIKEEFRNPTGSHYDRIYLSLFKSLERKGIIKRGKSHLVEVSSGNAGVSFAWFCKQLGYKCEVIIPKGINAEKCNEIREYGGKLIVSEINDYLNGAVKALRKRLSKNKDLYCVNHSRRDESLLGTENIGKELIQYFDENKILLDYFIPAIGNGSSIIGPGRILKGKYPNLQIIAFEDKNAPVGYKVKFPQKFKDEFGENYQFKYHHLFGTGAWGIYFPFIMDKKYKFSDLVDDIILLEDYEWLKIDEILDTQGYNVGHTSMAGFFVAMNLAKNVRNKNIVIIFYDQRSKYF